MAGCFVATAAYGNSECVEVRFLRAFREQVLLKTRMGRAFIYLYYGIGPHLAWVVGKVPFLKRLALRSIEEMIEIIEKHSSLKRETFRELDRMKETTDENWKTRDSQLIKDWAQS